MKEIKKMENCTYTCASCGSEFNILSTVPGKVSIDICSGCHPFYVGNTSNTTLRGRVEKLASKFDTAKTNSNKKPVAKKQVTKKQSKNKVGGLEIL